jgi:formate hydrogenlyase subunit 3/multisubunit Na+/H+ antiporter MnhD subunit
MTVGLFAKAAFFPLHGWLPPAHASAPAPASALLSALVVKAGFYLILRLWFEPFEASARPESLRTLIGVCGAGAVLWGSLLAIAQRRIKPLLAYSTVAQLGYLLQLFPLAGTMLAWGGTLVIAISHALAKAAMFLSAGLVIQALGHDRLDDIRGAAHTIPMTVFAFGLAGLSLVGLPPSGGFVGKWLLMAAALESGHWYWAFVPIGGGLLASIYVFGVLARAFLGPAVSEPFSPVARSAEIAALALAVASVLFGPFAWVIVQAFAPVPMAGGSL